MRSVSSVLACFLSPALAQLPAKEDQSGHAGMIDLRLMQIRLEDGQDTFARQPILEALNGGRSHEQSLRFPSTAQAGRLDPPGSEFRRCGEVWERYEQVLWGSNRNVLHRAVCASVNSDDLSIGICRSDDVGHDHWEFCAAPPPSKCDGLGKLYFVLCEDVTRVHAPPEDARPARRGARSSRASRPSPELSEETGLEKTIQNGSFQREDHQ